MTLNELIEKLEKLRDHAGGNAPVLLAKDETRAVATLRIRPDWEPVLDPKSETGVDCVVYLLGI